MALKVIMVGNSAVGKTSLVARYVEQPFTERTVSTSSPVFISATENVNGENVDLEIWDTAGQEQYRSLMAMYFRGANVALLCFSKETFGSIPEWNQAVKDAEPHCKILLVLTKSDLLSEDEIQGVYHDVEGLDSAIEYVDFLVTSSKSGEGVRELFSTAAKCSRKVKLAAPEPGLEPASPSDKKSCC